MAPLDLSAAHQPWWLAPTRRIPIDAPLDNPADLHDWIPAAVPGSVQRDLMQAGRLPDLYQMPDPDEALAAVDAQDWWYRTTLPAIEPGQRARLRFCGIDYQAAVSVGGEELGRGAGMFAARAWDITRWLQGGQAELAVRIWGGGALPRWPDITRLRWRRRLANRFQQGIPAFDDRLLTLKAPVHFGWDFAPRLLAAGIWDNVTLHVSRGVCIHDVWVRADWGPDLGMILRIELDSDKERRGNLAINLTRVSLSNDSQQQIVKKIHLRSGLQVLDIHWRNVELESWNTHDRGTPQLYRLALSFEDDEGILDEWETKVGARTIGWGSPAGKGRADTLYLNGDALRLRGVNWVPLDMLRGDEAEPARYRSLLELARAAGVNAVRVWGGGGRERKIFYDLCDELGLLVWQELPIACVFLDHMPDDDAFLELARRETRGIVRHLRGHPSLMMWGGGNEWGPGRNRALARALGETVSQEDPSRRWLPASPGPGDSHNWDVWHDKASPYLYGSDPAPLLSEFGLAAPPDPSVLSAMLPGDELWPPGDAWSRRKAELDKLWHYARPLLPVSQPEVTLDQFVAASQAAQARGLQAGIEAYRLREDAVGTFIWQWNEPWPAVCWSILPYKGPPKRAYQQIARSYAPMAPLARLLPDTIELWVVNDQLTSPGTCLLSAKLNDETIWQGDVVPPAHGRMLVTTLPRPASPSQAGAAALLKLHLTGPDLDACNDYDLAWRPTESRTSAPLRWLRQAGKRLALRW